MECHFSVRRATIDDLDAVAALEAICFPPAEAASRESFEWRLKTYPLHFWVIETEGRIISLMNGPVTKEADLIDEMYDSPSFSDESGDWQMVFGVATHPDFQGKGYAGTLIQVFIDEARADGRRGVVLTCKEHKLHYYAKFGFKDEGFTGSMHGGVPWHQMRLTF